jgi:hypothetical protein
MSIMKSISMKLTGFVSAKSDNWDHDGRNDELRARVAQIIKGSEAMHDTHRVCGYILGSSRWAFQGLAKYVDSLRKHLEETDKTSRLTCGIHSTDLPT